MGDSSYQSMFNHQLDRANRLEAALVAFIGYVGTCKRRNTPEWMAMLAERANVACEAVGSGSRFIWPGKWAHEFQFEVETDEVEKR